MRRDRGVSQRAPRLALTSSSRTPPFAAVSPKRMRGAWAGGRERLRQRAGTTSQAACPDAVLCCLFPSRASTTAIGYPW